MNCNTIAAPANDRRPTIPNDETPSGVTTNQSERPTMHENQRSGGNTQRPRLLENEERDAAVPLQDVIDSMWSLRKQTGTITLAALLPACREGHAY
jgi:hypothetical protein